MLSDLAESAPPTAARPWLAIYQSRIPQPQPSTAEPSSAPRGTVESDEHAGRRPSLAALLPDELVMEVLRRVDGYSLGSVMQVCRGWNALAKTPWLWRQACARAWPDEDLRTLQRRMQQYGSWRKMFTQREHLRFDGMYVQHVRFIRPGNRAEGRGMKVADRDFYSPILMMDHYRVVRFFPDGRVIAYAGSSKPAKLAPFMNSRSGKDGLFSGEYRVFESGEATVNVTYVQRMKKFPLMHPSLVTITMRFCPTHTLHNGIAHVPENVDELQDMRAYGAVIDIKDHSLMLSDDSMYFRFHRVPYFA